MHLTSLLNAPPRTLSDWVRTVRDMSIWPEGKAPTMSAKVLAGTVVEPSSSNFAPIQQVIAISRLVAERRRRELSVAIRMLLRTGRVLREATARLTMLNPLAR